MKESKNYLLKILKLQPKNIFAHKALSTIIDYNEDQNHLDEMMKLINEENFSHVNSDQKTQIFFALGKAYEDLKEFENSFHFLKKANLFSEDSHSYTLENTKKMFDNLIKLFDTLKIKKPKANTNKKNIFICGMPRSGTTLVEQMVASHGLVEGAGEIHYLSDIINKNFIENRKFNKSKILNEMDSEQNQVFSEYNNLIKFHNFKSDIITDKAPQNFMWIGFIKIFFPNSKIIHCFRNPKDNCLNWSFFVFIEI